MDVGLLIVEDTCGEKLCTWYDDSDHLRNLDENLCYSLQSIAVLTDAEAIEEAGWLHDKRVVVRFHCISEIRAEGPVDILTSLALEVKCKFTPYPLSY